MSLAITRRKGERLRVGDAIIEVAKIGGGQVCLRVTAPLDVKILREELVPVGSPLAGAAFQVGSDSVWPPGAE